MTNNPLLDDLPTPPTPNDIDLLNDRDPLSLSALHIDSIIAMHRQRRALKASGDYKSTKSKPATSVDLSSVLLRAGLGQPEKPKPIITTGGAFRRRF